MRRSARTGNLLASMLLGQVVDSRAGAARPRRRGGTGEAALAAACAAASTNSYPCCPQQGVFISRPR